MATATKTKQRNQEENRVSAENTKRNSKSEENSKMTSSEKAARLKAVDLAVEQIERQFGQGSIMKLGEGSKVSVDTFPSGSLSLDLALGGGIPRGRILKYYF